MALKPDQEYNETTSIRYFWSEMTGQETAERGGCASQESVGSGVALDDENNFAAYAADGSGAVALGILKQDVNPPMTATRDFPDLQSGEKRPGDKVTLVRKGWMVTDMVSGAVTAGATLYLGDSGYMTATQVSAGHPVVGRIETTRDSDNFLTVFMDI